MGVNFNPYQQAAISAYRKKHNITSKVTDEAVAAMIKKQGGKNASVFNDSQKPKQVATKPNNKTSNTKAKTSAKPTTKQAETTQDKELKALGLINKDGAGSKIKSKKGTTFTVVGKATNGRTIVKDSKGGYQVIAADGVLLKKDYVIKSNKVNAVKTNSKAAQSAAINAMKHQLTSAQKSFNKQLSQDGWAGDVADGISVLWGSKNRASKVRVDLNEYNKNIQDLQKAAKKGDAQFKAKFKQIYGKDFNQQAMADYVKNPTQKNYQKVFGSKNNIYARVTDYNKSQQTGAEVVKTSAKVGTGLAIGAATVATGGTAGALLLTAAGTTMASAAIDETDRLNVKDVVTKGKINFREGTDHKKIMTNAAFDGISTLAGGAVGKLAMGAVKGASTGSKIARAAINTAGDVGVGAAQEYVETGHVTAGGIISNAAMSGVGGAVVSGTLKGVGKSVKLVKGKTKSFKAKITPKTTTKTTTNKAVATTKTTTHNNTAATENIAPKYNENGEMLAGGSFFHKFSVSNLFGRSKAKLSPKELMKHAENNIEKQIKLGDPGTVDISRKLKEELSSPTIAKEFPSGVNLNNINSHIKPGEVCAVGSGTNQKLYVNNNGTAQEIQLSRETFDRLFPQGGFAMTSQKADNNCWILSKINAMTGSNTGKAELYSMFKELPNGDVQILLPNSSRPITFPKGKPLATMSARQIQEGGAPGVEMLQQAVQAKRIQQAEKTPISNIEDCGIEKLNAEERRMGLDSEATAMLIDKNKFTTKTINDNQYADLENTLSTFNSKEDMGTVTFEAHARTIVDYNPRTKMVTYHNPYNGGVDITCSLEDLKKKSAHFAISKLKQKARNTTTQTVSEQAQNVAQQATTPKRRVVLPNDKPVTRTGNVTSNPTSRPVSARAQNVAQQATTTPKRRVVLPSDKPVTRTGNVTSNPTTRPVSARAQTKPVREPAIQTPPEQSTNILGSKFIDLSDSGVKIKQSESGTILVQDKVGNEYHTTVDVGETRPIITDATGNKFSVTRDKNGQVRIVSEKASNKVTPKNIEEKVSEPKIETRTQSKTVENGAGNAHNVEVHNNSASTQEKLTHESKATSSVATNQQKPETKMASKPQTLDDVFDAMEVIVKKQGARRKEITKPFDTQIENLQSKQAKLEADFEAYRKSTKEKVSELQTSNNKIMAEIRSYEAVSRESSQRANILKRKISQFRTALYDLEKVFDTYQRTGGSQGGSIRELDEFTRVLRDKTQGGVISYHSDSLNAIGKGELPNYEYNEEIGDLFHNYNIRADKESVINELRAKLGALEQQSNNLDSVIQSNDNLLAELKQTHSDNSKLMSQLDDSVEARKKELSKSLKQNSTEIEEIKQNREKALNDLQNTPEYKASNENYKTLQLKARELSKK